MLRARQTCRMHGKSGWTEVQTSELEPVDFRLHLPVLEDEGSGSKALAVRFLLFSLLAKASK